MLSVARLASSGSGTRTDSYLRDGSVSDLAEPLAKDPAAPDAVPPQWVEARHGLRGTSADGGYSTAEEMLRFARGLLAAEVVSKETLSRMATPQPPIDDEFYGYGWGLLLSRSKGGVPSFGHGGTASGINFELRIFPAEDVILVAFNNQDNGAHDDLRNNITKLITGDR